MKLIERIARIKLVSFEEAIKAVVAHLALDLPEPPKSGILCPLPGHEEKTGSFSLQRRFFNCFGCGRKGDAIDFARHHQGVELADAVAIVEAALGIGDASEGLVALARREARPSTAEERARWEEALGRIEQEFLGRVRPYLRSPDPDVAGLAAGRAEAVWAALDHASLVDGAPVTRRGFRERVRELRAFARDHARELEEVVEAVQGRDPPAVAALSPPEPRLSPLEFRVARGLIGALERRAKIRAKLLRARRLG